MLGDTIINLWYSYAALSNHIVVQLNFFDFGNYKVEGGGVPREARQVLWKRTQTQRRI